MTNRPEGKLYRASGAEHPDAKEVNPSRRLSKQLPSQRSSSIPSDFGFTPAQVYAFLAAPVFLLAALEGKFFPSTNWIFTSVWVLLSIYITLRAAADSYWAAWTAPPIVFAVAVLVHLNMSGKGFGGIAITQVLGLLFGLSERMWVILIITGVCWFISRRKLVANHKAHRAQRASN